MKTLKQIEMENSKKDFYDKLSSFSGVFIAIAGLFATFDYNKKQLSIQQKKSEAEIKIQSLKNDEEIQNSRINLMEKNMKYITSDKANERVFGYEVFLISGHKDLGEKLIKLRAGEDSAAVIVLRKLTTSDNKLVRDDAKKTLSRLDVAKDYEEKGFNFLLNKELDKAIQSFSSSENSYNGYHQVYEIRIFLNRNQENPNWEKIYSEILQNYSWGMTADFKQKFSSEIK